MDGKKAMPQVPDGGYGWVIVAASSIINLSVLPVVQCFGILFQDKFRTMHVSGAEISFLMHLINAVMCSLGLISGPLFRRFNYQQIAFAGSIIMTFGTCLMSVASSYFMFVMTCIILGVGQGVLFPALSLSVNTYFKERRSLAMGISITCTGLGPILSPIVSAHLLDYFGTSGTVLLLGAFSLHSIIGAILMRPLQPLHQGLQRVTTQADDEEDHDRNDNEVVTDPKCVEEETAWQKITRIFSFDLLRDRTYALILVGMSVSYVAELNFVLLSPFVLGELAKFEARQIATAMSVQAVADILARMAVPILAQHFKWSAKLLYAQSLLISCLGRSIFSCFYQSKGTVLLTFALLGVAKGVKAVFQALIVPNYVHLDDLPAATGLLMVSNGLLSLCLGPALGYVHDMSSSYLAVVHTDTALSLSCVLLWSLEYALQGKKSVLTRIESVAQ